MIKMNVLIQTIIYFRHSKQQTRHVLVVLVSVHRLVVHNLVAVEVVGSIVVVAEDSLVVVVLMPVVGMAVARTFVVEGKLVEVRIVAFVVVEDNLEVAY